MIYGQFQSTPHDHRARSQELLKQQCPKELYWAKHE